MEETDGQSERKSKGMKSMARQQARGWARRAWVLGVDMSVSIYILYNRLLCISMYIISVYMYIYILPRGENFLTLNRTRNAWEKSGERMWRFT